MFSWGVAALATSLASRAGVWGAGDTPSLASLVVGVLGGRGQVSGFLTSLAHDC